MAGWIQKGAWTQSQARQQLGSDRLHGSLVEWKGRFGWLTPDVEIDHPEAAKNNWRVFISVSDLEGDTSWLAQGVRLSFVAYADGKGIGAEQVRYEEEDWEEPVAHLQSGSKSPAGPSWEEEDWEEPASNLQSGIKSPASPAWQVQKTIVKKPVVAKTPPKLLPTPKVKPAKGVGKAGAKASGKPVVSASKGPGLGPQREKSTHSGQCGFVEWASSEVQGWRPAMEDAVRVEQELSHPLDSYAMFGVFDGHGGAEVSRRAAAELPGFIVSNAAEAEAGSDVAQQALEWALPALDDKLRADGDGEQGMLGGAAGGKPILSDVKNAFGLMGSTAVVALMECEGSPTEGRPLRVVVGNVGDSRAALCRAGEAVALTEDHKPDDPGERSRIEGAGGFVAAVGPCQRIDGWGLNLSRALGDFHYKAREDLPYDQQKVSCAPDVRSSEITDQDEFLFLGCDGVFELHSTQGAIDIARASMAEGKPLPEVVEDLVDACVSPNLMTTMGHGGDNVSAMIVRLRPDLVC